MLYDRSYTNIFAVLEGAWKASEITLRLVRFLQFSPREFVDTAPIIVLARILQL
jgi:hypothetical protein